MQFKQLSQVLYAAHVYACRFRRALARVHQGINPEQTWHIKPWLLIATMRNRYCLVLHHTT